MLFPRRASREGPLTKCHQVTARDSQLLGDPELVYEMDLETCPAAAAKGFADAPFRFEGVAPARVSAFLGFFDVEFAEVVECNL